MIVVCDNCGTRYRVAEQDLGEEGREVRCIRCSHVWVQSSFHQDITENKIADVPPANHSTLWLSFTTVILSLLIVVALFFSPREHIVPWLRPLYSMFSIYDSSGLEFQNAAFERYKINDKEGIMIVARIVNNSNETRIMPYIQISTYESDINDASIIDLNNHFESLAPGESKEVMQHIDELPADSRYVTLDLGNKLEMWFQ